MYSVFSEVSLKTTKRETVFHDLSQFFVLFNVSFDEAEQQLLRDCIFSALQHNNISR